MRAQGTPGRNTSRRARLGSTAAGLMAVTIPLTGAIWPASPSASAPGQSTPASARPAAVASASVADAAKYPCGGYGGFNLINPPDDVLADKFTWGIYKGVTVGDGTGNINWANTKKDDSWYTWLNALSWIGAAVRLGSTDRLDVRRPELLDHSVAIVQDWIKDHPLPWVDGPGAANSAMTRTNTLLCLREAIVKVSGDSPAWLDATLRTHASYLNQSWLGGRWGTNNIATDQQIAMMGVGCTLGDKPMIDTAVGRLATTISKVIDAQGANDEQSTGYADWNWNLWGKAENYIATCGVTGSTAGSIRARRAALQGFLDQATTPKGTLAQLGDTETTKLPITRSAAQAWAQSNGRQGSPPAGRVAVYNAGYVFGRSSWGAAGTVAAQSFYSLRFGPTRSGHGHADHTSMTWQARGRDILIDPGRGSYNTDAWRAYYVGPTAHNQVVFEGHTTGAKPTTLKRYTVGNGDFFEFTDHPMAPRTRSRQVYVAKGSDLMVVRDQVSSQTVKTSWTSYWHLPYDQNASVVDRHRVVAIKPGERTKTTLLQLPVPKQKLTPLSIVKGKTSRGIQGWYWRDNFTRYPAPVVQTTGSGMGATMLTAVVVGDSKEAVSTKPALAAKGGGLTYRIIVGKRTLRFTVAKDGTISAA